MIKSRVQKLLLNMEKSGIDTLFVTDEKNMHYYSGFYRGEGYLVINKDFLALVTDSRYTEYAAMTCRDYEVKNIRDTSFSDFVREGDVCGFEDMSISYELYRRLSAAVPSLKPIGDMTRLQRQIKDEYEISCIKKAANIADMAFEHICSYISCGISEKAVAAELEGFMKKNGADDIAFATIAASGTRASLPHAIPTDAPIERGSFLVLDYGCVIDGYCSDMTRTLAIGDVSDEMEDIYSTVLKSQLLALDSLKSGITGKDADRAARDYLDKYYKGAFAHSLGHSVGLDIHESPNLSPREDNKILPSMVVTVEPGIYIEGFTGVRIEDLVLIGEDKNEILSKSTKKLLKL